MAGVWTANPLNNWGESLPEGASVIGQPLVKSSEDDAIDKLANEWNLKLDDQTKDYLMQYYLNEKSAENAYGRSREYNKSYYSDLVEGLKKAGINPFLALSSLSGTNLSNGAGSVSGGLYTQRQNAKKENAANVSKSIMSVLAIVAAAVITAML